MNGTNGATADFRLDGKVAIVTGAGRGLGQAIAVALARAGASVVLVARSVEQLEATAVLVREAGGKASVLPLDVTVDGAPERAVQAAVARFGSLDILVYSAGTATTRAALSVTNDEWDLTLGVNLRAAFFWSRAAGARMAENGGGRIIHLASVSGEMGISRLSAYSASKGGLIALCRSLAVEWAPLGITVNALAPGYVRTALNTEALEDPRLLDLITRRTPMRRLGQADEVASAAVFLSSQEASYITGHVLAVDGGWLAS